MSRSNITDFEGAPFEIIDGDRGKNYPKQNALFNSGYCLFLSATNVTRSGFEFSECQFITDQKDEVLRKGKLQRDDVVLTTRGTIGNAAHFNASIPYDHMRINSGMVILRCNAEKILPTYLYHFLRTPSFHGQVNSLRSGVAQPQLPIRDMKRIKMPLPPLSRQIYIASILSAYDDLIENNRRRIQLLEQSARLLYKEWFVHLRFPGHEHTTITDGVPEGWEKGTVGDISTRIKVKYTINDENLPLVDLSRIRGKTSSVVEIGSSKDLETSRIIFEIDDILFSSIRPYLHKVVFAPFKGITNTSVFVARANVPWLRSYLTILLSSNYAIAYANQHTTGTKMPVVKWISVASMPVLIPPKSVLAHYEVVVGVMLQKIKQLYFVDQQLAKARDLLMPRLMNGEIVI